MPPPLFRGVPRSTQRGRDALKSGRVVPRGRSTDYESHVRNQGVAADVTSWTTEEAEARKFGDVILVVDKDKVRDRIVDPHPLPNYLPHEKEVLIRGPVDADKVITLP